VSFSGNTFCGGVQIEHLTNLEPIYQEKLIFLATGLLENVLLW
jgi:hypothetical protein